MSLSQIRSKIDEIDTAMLALIALRIEQSKTLKDIKRGLPVQDKGREELLRRKWKTQAAALGVNESLSLSILELLLLESKRLQSA